MEHTDNTKRRRLSTEQGCCFGGIFPPSSLENRGGEPDDLSSSVLSAVPTGPLFARGKPHKVDSAAETDADIDRLLAHEMSSLSVAERERVFDDIHGTRSQLLEETEAILEDKIEKLREEVDRISNKDAYDQAIALRLSVGKSSRIEDDFLRMFLRGQEYNPRNAAKRLVSFYELKLRLFGPALLDTPLRWEHLSSKDQQAILDGLIQEVPLRDQAGRAIHFVPCRFFAKYDRMTTCRAFFYFSMSALRDERVQKNGVVIIAWDHGTVEMQDFDIELDWQLGKSLPSRVTSFHYCGSHLNPALHFSLQVANSHYRSRFKFHVGSPMECIYDLAGYGIRKDALPVDEFDHVSLENHFQWITRNRQEEQTLLQQQQFQSSIPALGLNSSNAGGAFFLSPNIARATSPNHQIPGIPADELLKLDSTFLIGQSGIIQPAQKDVLLGGNSKEYYESPGNIAFRQLLEKFSTEYDAAISNDKKRDLCDRIIGYIHETGGRFLIRKKDGSLNMKDPSSSYWEVVDHKSTQKRIGQAFRNRRNRRRPREPSPPQQRKVASPRKEVTG